MEATDKSKKCLQMMPLAWGCADAPIDLLAYLGILINIRKPGPRRSDEPQKTD